MIDEHLLKSILIGIGSGLLFLVISFLYLGKEANKIEKNKKGTCN